MTKSFFLRHRRLFGAAALCIALLALTLAYWQSRTPATPPAGDVSAAMLAELRQSTAPWTAQRRDLSALVRDMRDGRIASAALSDEAVYVTTREGQRYWLADQSGRIGEMILRDYGSGAMLFPVSLFDTDGEAPWYRELKGQWPLLLILLLGIGLVVWKLRPQQALKHDTGVRFADVIGASEAKLALQDVTTYLRDPAAFATLGARPPKGVLLTGEPGTGKTQLAKALAGECGAHFIQVTGSDFSSMYFGVGIHKVKSLFRTARKHAPCIVFIDEIDGIGRRGEQSRSSDAEANRIINQFLTEMDGFAADSGVLVLAATNFPNSLDPALLREGRFDRNIAVGLPGLAEREQLFRLYAGKVKAADDLDHAQLARNSVGLTPAAIAYIVNHAALLAARERHAEVTMRHCVDALETCRIGEQPTGVSPLSDAERTRIAVHEADSAQGLALVLERLRDYKLVLIDTAGLGQRDRNLVGQLNWLRASGQVQTLLCLPANSHFADLDEVVRRFSTVQPQGVVLTKLDETGRLGSALSVVVDHQLPMAWVTDGQRVPDDLHRANSAHLVLRLDQLRREADEPCSTEATHVA